MPARRLGGITSHAPEQPGGMKLHSKGPSGRCATVRSFSRRNLHRKAVALHVLPNLAQPTASRIVCEPITSTVMHATNGATSRETRLRCTCVWPGMARLSLTCAQHGDNRARSSLQPFRPTAALPDSTRMTHDMLCPRLRKPACERALPTQWHTAVPRPADRIMSARQGAGSPGTRPQCV